MSDFNENVINEFRTNGGKVGGRFEGAPKMILEIPVVVLDRLA